MLVCDEDKEKGKGKGKEVDKLLCYVISSLKDVLGLNVLSFFFVIDIDVLWFYIKV